MTFPFDQSLSQKAANFGGNWGELGSSLPYISGGQMARKIDPQSSNDEVLGNTVKEMLGKKEMIAPLCISWLVDCVQMLPMNLSIQFSKIYGKWAVSNMPIQSLREHTQTNFSGINFIVVEFTLEKALARAIHYYYHTEEKNNGLLHCEI